MTTKFSLGGDTSGTNGTAYGAFFGSPLAANAYDLGFAWYDSSSGVANGVDLLAFSKSKRLLASRF